MFCKQRAEFAKSSEWGVANLSGCSAYCLPHNVLKKGAWLCLSIRLNSKQWASPQGPWKGFNVADKSGRTPAHLACQYVANATQYFDAQLHSTNQEILVDKAWRPWQSLKLFEQVLLPMMMIAMKKMDDEDDGWWWWWWWWWWFHDH